MADSSKKELKRRDIAYYRRRQQNRVFTAVAQLFAEEAENGNITKKELAELLGKDPAQISRWLGAPSNFELDTISDILLAMGAEMDCRVARLNEHSKPNYAHPMISRYVTSHPFGTGELRETHRDVTGREIKLAPPTFRTTSRVA